MSNQSTNYTCSKQFQDFPCCHRQWKHEGHCRFVHGYSRSFTFWFSANALDRHGFVVDFSSLNSLHEKLKKQFDHTFLINRDDPLLPVWENLHEQGALDLRVMENVGMEFTARMVWEWANLILLERDEGRACCSGVEARENQFNSASYKGIPEWFSFNGDTFA